MLFSEKLKHAMQDLHIQFFWFIHCQFTSDTILQFRYRGVNVLRVRE